MHNYAIIVAGGKGTRMGGDLPKQFLPLAGRPVLMHTLEAFAAALPQISLILVLPKDQQEYWKNCCTEHHFTLAHHIADGGATRFESVLHGLQCIPATEEAIVGVHDGVRPFVAKEVIQNCYAQAAQHRAVVPVVPVVETLRQVSTSQTVSRSDYRLVQTPQTFRLSLLRQAYEQPYNETFTDDASVVEALGEPITLVEGNRENIKLTTPFDLIIANALMKTQTKTQTQTQTQTQTSNL